MAWPGAAWLDAVGLGAVWHGLALEQAGLVSHGICLACFQDDANFSMARR
jgi:hypothetical protein